MHFEDSHAVIEVGKLDINLTVETSGTHESLVENIGAVGGGKDNHAAVGAETVHLGEQLVECVLTLVVGTHIRVLAACASHGVNLVDKYDTGGFFLGLTEEVAHT